MEDIVHVTAVATGLLLLAGGEKAVATRLVGHSETGLLFALCIIVCQRKGSYLAQKLALYAAT
jgi:hypothetical protein